MLACKDCPKPWSESVLRIHPTCGAGSEFEQLARRTEKRAPNPTLPSDVKKQNDDQTNVMLIPKRFDLFAEYTNAMVIAASTGTLLPHDTSMNL